MSQYLAKIEALLFVAGEEGLNLRQLVAILDLPATALQQQLVALSEKYDRDETSSLSLLETAGAYRLVTKAAYADLLQAYAKTPMNQSLSRASLEVLAIIAYKQPITRVEVDMIRGVNSSGAISKLQLLGLIKEAGKKEVIGRPNLYETTDYFLDYMGINYLEELVDASHLTLEVAPSDLFTHEREEEENEDQ